MVTEQQVLYLNYLKSMYGKDLKAFMIQSLTNHAIPVAHDSMATNLLPQIVPDFYTEFEKAGGDSDYLQFAVQVFLQVRTELLNSQRVNGHA